MTVFVISVASCLADGARLEADIGSAEYLGSFGPSNGSY